MWQFLALLIGSYAMSASSAILDMNDICIDSRTGDVVPHPMDCQAYFICGPIPTVRYCDSGLHFDAIHKVCNWPENAKCDILSTMVEDDVIQPDIFENEDKQDVPSAVKLHPIFIAIDVDSGEITDPMDKYDPKNVQCRHFGAYFLPHPGSCRRYYICAYGHLHRHKCGSGTAWSYKRQECELSAEAECYSRLIAGMDIDADNNEISTFDDIEAFTTMTTPSPTTTTGASTVCFVIDTTVVTGTGTTDTTFHPTGSYHTATSDTTWYPTGSYHTATSDTTWYPTGSYHTATTASPLKQPGTTKRTDNSVYKATGGLKCPQEGSGYLPNIFDCNKYYICINGAPVPTHCPQDSYWDQNAKFCDSEKNVQCYSKNKF